MGEGGAELATVLVVEDEPLLRRYLAEVLSSAGYRVLQAEDGSSALAVLGGDAPDLLVTDVVLGEMSGPELADDLGRGRPGLKTLFVSGYSEKAFRLSAALPRGVAYLAKPFTGPELIDAVRRLLDETP